MDGVIRRRLQPGVPIVVISLKALLIMRMQLFSLAMTMSSAGWSRIVCCAAVIASECVRQVEPIK
jgi:hypothetical protein